MQVVGTWYVLNKHEPFLAGKLVDGWETDKDETQRQREGLGYGNRISDSYFHAEGPVQWTLYHDHGFSPAVTETHTDSGTWEFT